MEFYIIIFYYQYLFKNISYIFKYFNLINFKKFISFFFKNWYFKFKIVQFFLYFDNFMLIKSQSDLNNFMQKRSINKSFVGGLIGTEGSHALDGDLENVKRLYDKGFRMMSLHHFFDNRLGGSLHGISGQGLTNFGEQVVLEIQNLDIILDVSHSSENVVKDVLKISNRPMVVSHTGFYGHCPSPRNINDNLMEDIARKGGLIAIGYWDAAVCDNTPKSVAEAIHYGIKLVVQNMLH